jgi:hypothetical protein
MSCICGDASDRNCTGDCRSNKFSFFYKSFSRRRKGRCRCLFYPSSLAYLFSHRVVELHVPFPVSTFGFHPRASLDCFLHCKISNEPRQFRDQPTALAPVKRLYFCLMIRLLQSTDLLLERPWSKWGNYRLLNSELVARNEDRNGSKTCLAFVSFVLFCFFFAFLFLNFNLILIYLFIFLFFSFILDRYIDHYQDTPRLNP